MWSAWYKGKVFTHSAEGISGLADGNYDDVCCCSDNPVLGAVVRLVDASGYMFFPWFEWHQLCLWRICFTLDWCDWCNFLRLLFHFQAFILSILWHALSCSIISSYIMPIISYLSGPFQVRRDWRYLSRGVLLTTLLNI